jgi:putative DNA primase/helicase
VANGTLDLRTGTLGSHDPAHRLTRLTPIVHDAHARSPAFERFLRQRLGHAPELIAFLQKAVGLTLTGAVSEQVLFFLHGDGRTGKSTFVNLIRELLGGLAVHTPVESFTTKPYETIRTDLARMAGARMVTAGEIHPSQQFDEAAIKGLTGGDPITARFMRQDLFQYMPQFKLWLYANHFPKVRATDNAFWRRIRVLPFISVVPEGKVEQGLPERLRAELPGVLNWAVTGCLAWQREGLDPPDVVRAATEAWRHGADHVSRYLRERTVPETGARIGAAELLADFGAWCAAAGEQPVSPATFKERLTALGRVSRKTNRGHFWLGLRLRG